MAREWWVGTATTSCTAAPEGTVINGSSGDDRMYGNARKRPLPGRVRGTISAMAARAPTSPGAASTRRAFRRAHGVQWPADRRRRRRDEGCGGDPRAGAAERVARPANRGVELRRAGRRDRGRGGRDEGPGTVAVGVGVPSVVEFASGRVRSSINVHLADLDLRLVLGSASGCRCSWTTTPPWRRSRRPSTRRVSRSCRTS